MKKSELKRRIKEAQERDKELNDAAQKLIKSGFTQIKNLYHISDIQDHFYCPKHMAEKILDEAYEQMEREIWDSIVYKCYHYEIPQKDLNI
jgi:hypothetical protein